MKSIFIFIRIFASATGVCFVIVCHCTGASDRAIRRAVRSGAVTVSEVSDRCAAGAFCGGCRPVIAEIIGLERRSFATATEVPAGAGAASAR
ncbi:MAG: (2Fe-2S)-binding protein [Deltaproteobacteria bacterium]|nr:MAG: (2Fe-2S)-binding protein [Deltaproteobacteria bacterium]